MSNRKKANAATLRVLIRSDASPTIGVGHIMRDLVLADALRNGGCEVAFASLEIPEHLAAKVGDAGYALHRLASGDAGELVGLLARLESDWVVFDHYGIDADFEAEVRSALPLRVLAFDDTYRPHDCDILLNHGIQARASRYRGLVPEGARVLCGSAYTLVRPAFLARYSRRNASKRIERILVTMGGTDVKNLSLAAVRYLKRLLRPLSATVVTTSANPNLSRLCRARYALGYRLVVDTERMPELMAAHDLVITAGGGTLFELLAARKLFVTLSVASNQDDMVAWLKRHGIRATLHGLDYRRLHDALHDVSNNRRTLLRQMAKIRFGTGRIASVMKEIS